MELEGLGSLMRRWMKVPYLEFKQDPHQQPSRSWKWGIKQRWREAWGIDYESQVETVKEKHTECDDTVDGIKVCYVLQYTLVFLSGNRESITLYLLYCIRHTINFSAS